MHKAQKLNVIGKFLTTTPGFSVTTPSYNPLELLDRKA